MGLVKKGDQEQRPAEPPETPAPDDPPVVKQLKELDDQYLELEREYDRECQKLLLQYNELQKPLLLERKQVLLTADDTAAPATGTPGLADFWLKAMKNHEAFEDLIQEYDEPVLSYLQDIETGFVDELDSNKGFTLEFHFAENPYFSNTDLKKEYILEESNPYAGEIAVKEIKVTEIKWHPGKDVTVEKVQKKVKGGGAKKQKQKQKEREEPRPSFFRDFFRNLKVGMQLPEDAKMQARGMMDDEDEDEEDEDDDGDDEALLSYLMDGDQEAGAALRDNIIPFAVRWYTGEAAPDHDDDDDDEDDDDEDDEDDDEESEEEEEEEPPARGRGKAAPKKKGSKSKSETKPAEAPKEDCKQQ